MRALNGHIEIRKPTYLGGDPTDKIYDWDIVEWSEDFQHCWSLAFLKYDPKEGCYDLEGVGTRLCRSEYVDNDILKWIGKFADFAAVGPLASND